MNYQTIRFEESEPGIGLLHLNRPKRLNALNLEMLDELYHLFSVLNESPTVRVLIITGEGEGFCSGADLDFDEKTLQELCPNAATFLDKVQKKYSGLIIEMRRLQQPIIAAVNGAAAGGGLTMALAADVIYAGPNARFTASFVNIGLTGGELGTTYFLPHRIGTVRTAEFLMTGRTIAAEEADRIGMVCRTVEQDQLMAVAMDTARQMVDKSKLGLRLTKEALNLNLNASSLEAAVELENRNQALLAFTPEFFQRIMAFNKT